MAWQSPLSIPNSRAICNPERFRPIRYKQVIQTRNG